MTGFSKDLSPFDQLKADISVFVHPCMKVEITDDETYEKAMRATKTVKEYSKKVEARRVELKAPYADFVKQIDAYAKVISQPLLEAETHLKRQLKIWNDVLEARRLEEEHRLEQERMFREEAARQEIEAAKEEAEAMAMFMGEKDAKRAEIVAEAQAERSLVNIAEDHKANLKGLSSMKVSGARKVWTFEVTNEEDIPREFLVVDEAKIRRAMNAGAREIPGVRIYQDTRIAIG